MSLAPINPRRSSAMRPGLSWRITIRLRDAGLRQRQTKMLYPDHRLPPWLNDAAATRDRSNQLIAVIYAIANIQDVCVYEQPRR